MTLEAHLQDLQPGEIAEVERVVEAFETAWDEGESPTVKLWLPDNARIRSVVAIELAYIDLEHRIKRGEKARVENYFDVLQDLLNKEAVLRGLVRSEFALRKRFEGPVQIEELGSRFPDMIDQLVDLTQEPSTNPSQDTEEFNFQPSVRNAFRELPKIKEFEIISELGRGGMGVVYKARDKQREQLVALKTLFISDASKLYRLKREFRMLANVVHPNLVMLFEMIADQHNCFFTMELIDGKDLASYVRGNSLKDMTPDEQFCRLRNAIRQLSSGIAALHRAGVVHRDIKPSNIIVCDTDRAVLLDFGLSTEMSRKGVYQSSENAILGTVPYMSPEQSDGRVVTPATDWYSLGVVIYELLTGYLPFEGGAYEILKAKQKHEPAPPKSLSDAIPDDLNELCVELLCMDPDARPSYVEIERRLGQNTCRTHASNELSSSSDKIFVGRNRELQELVHWLQLTFRERVANTVLISGESGVGKSELVVEFLDELRRDNSYLILAGRCYQQELVPYGGFQELGMELYVAATEIALGKMIEHKVDTAMDWMISQGVKDPPKMAAMLIPGCLRITHNRN